MKKKFIFSSFLFLIIPLFLSVQNIWALSSEDKNQALNKALNIYDQQENIAKEKRDANIEKTLRDISVELTFEYAFNAKAEQSFELLNDVGGRASKLTYSGEGKMLIVKGELGFFSKFFLGGRFASSDFKKTISSDEDWGFWADHNGEVKYIEYQVTRQGCKSKVEFFDANLYYRLSDFKEDPAKQRRLSPGKNTLFDNLMIDRLSLDIFAGYQRYKGRYASVDPMLEALRLVDGVWWEGEGLPADIGLNSPYKISYEGPRFGLRVKGSKDKIATQLSLAYCAGLKTEAYGYWNLRDLSFWQKGRNGYGLDFGCEITYSFTPFFSAGLGYSYLYFKQNKLKMYAVEAGVPWWEGFQDRIKNAESEISYPSVIFKYIW